MVIVSAKTMLTKSIALANGFSLLKANRRNSAGNPVAIANWSGVTPSQSSAAPWHARSTAQTDRIWCSNSARSGMARSMRFCIAGSGCGRKLVTRSINVAESHLHPPAISLKSSAGPRENSVFINYLPK